MDIKELMESRDGKNQEIEEVISKAKEEKRELTEDELASVEEKKKEIREASKQLDEAIESERKLKEEEIEAIRTQKAEIEKSLGEKDQAIKEIKSQLEERENSEKELKEKVEELETEKRNLENLKVVNNKGKMKERFNLSKALISAYKRKAIDGVEGKIQDGLIQRSHYNPGEGSILVPMHSRAQGDGHDTTVQDGNIDQVAVPDLSIVGKKPLWKEMGVRYLPNLQGTVTLPYKSPKVGQELAEIASVTLDTVTASGVLLSPKRYSVQQRWSKELLSSENPVLHEQMIADMAAGVERKISQVVYQKAVAGATGIAAANAIDKDSLDLLMAGAEIENDGIFMSNRTQFFAAKSSAIDAGSGRFLAQLGSEQGKGVTYDGVPYFYSSLFLDATNPTTVDYVVYGDPYKIVVGDWGMYEIIVNPYTYAGSGEVEITVCRIANVALHDPNAFVKSADVNSAT